MNNELLSCLANGLVEDRIRSTDAETTVENIAVIIVVLFTYVKHGPQPPNLYSVDMTIRLTIFDDWVTKIFSVDQSYKSKTNNNRQQFILLFSSPLCHVVRLSTILVQNVFPSSFASELNVGNLNDIPAKQVLGKYIGEPCHFRSDVIQATKVKVVIHVLFAGSLYYRTLYDRYLEFIM